MKTAGNLPKVNMALDAAGMVVVVVTDGVGVGVGPLD